MISLILNPTLSPQERSFSKNIVLVGGALAENVDILLSSEQHDKIILQFSAQDNEWFVHNVQNDPLLSLNDIPFWKRLIKPSDLISVGGTQIQFNSVQKENEKRETITPKITPTPTTWKIMRQAHHIALEEGAHAPPTTKDEEFIPTFAIKKLPPEEDEKVRSFLEDAWPLPTNPSYEEKVASELKFHTPPPKVVQKFALYSALILATLLVSAVALFYVMHDRILQQEALAAQGLADVAVALTYAEMHKIHPVNQNWNDPGFLSDTINTLLPTGYEPLGKIDAHGNFLKCPYTLRVYLNEDATQFIAIAQPLPGMLQWLLPKKTIIFDSSSMEIRKTKRLRELNRLLVKSYNLQEGEALAISALFRQSEKIPLSQLERGRKNLGFAPPRELAYLRPGAENHLYNAPRYYKLGEDMLKELNLAAKPSRTASDGAHLLRTLDQYSKFDDMILYTTESFASAQSAQKRLSGLMHIEEPLVGYLEFNKEDGIIDCHLLIGNRAARPEEVIHTPLQEQIAYVMNGKQSSRRSDDNTIKDQPLDIKSRDAPSSFQVFPLAREREKELLEKSKEMEALLSEHSRLPIPHFALRFQAIWEEFQEADQKYLEKMQTLKELIDKDAPSPEELAGSSFPHAF